MKDQPQTTAQTIESLKHSKELDRLLLENADEALFFYSMEGKIIYVNAAFKKITGYEIQELHENNFIPYVHPDDRERTMALWENLFKGLFFENVEYRIIKKDGEIRWSSSSWKIVCDSEGKPIGIQGKQQDITERKKVEEEKDRLVESLQEALNQIKTLKGIIPICAYCHNIRDDEGAWNRLEAYISENSNARFTHGICPECSVKILADLNNHR